MCSFLGNHVFDYGQIEPEDQMRTIREKLLHNVGIIIRHNISNKLLNDNTVIIPKPEHTQDSLDEHQLATERRDQPYQHLAE